MTEPAAIDGEPAEYLYMKCTDYTDTQMGSKTISITDATYDRLRAVKGSDESFSDVINRLLDAGDDDHALTELVGLVTEAELKRIKDRSATIRSELDDRFESDST